MPRARNLSSRDCNEVIEGINKVWFDDFKNNTDKITSHSNVERFLKLKIFNNKPFNSFDINEIINFYDFLEKLPASPATINNYLNAIIKFRDYLIKKYPNDFPNLFLHEAGDLRHAPKELGQFEKIPLNYYQLSLIRKYPDTKPVTKYIFEIFFQLGIDKKDIEFCNSRNADFEKMEFRTDNDPIRYNTVIQNMLLKYTEELADIELTVSKASSRFESLTNYLIKNNANGKYTRERPLCYEDIRYTHSLFIFTCPNCNMKHENISSNWVLAKTEFEEEYRLVCNICKGVLVK